jgi:hypothetical protein
MMKSEHVKGVLLFLESTQIGQLLGRVRYLVAFLSVTVVDVNLRKIGSRCLLECCAPPFAKLVNEWLIYRIFSGVIKQAGNR